MPKTAVVLLLLSCPAWASTLVQDFGFEDPVITDPSHPYSYRPTGTAWDFGAGSDGITAVTSDPSIGFGMTSAESGNQAAFIQKANSEISQIITLAPGFYRVGFYAATRPDTPGSNPFFGGGEDFNVFWNSTLIGTYLPTSTTFSFFTSDYFQASGTGVLSFVGIDSNNSCDQDPSYTVCDRTAFIDDVGIYTPEPSGTVLLFSGILLIGLVLRRDLVKIRAL